MEKREILEATEYIAITPKAFQFEYVKFVKTSLGESL